MKRRGHTTLGIGERKVRATVGVGIVWVLPWGRVRGERGIEGERESTEEGEGDEGERVRRGREWSQREFTEGEGTNRVG
jgi:hypothetical protein